MTYTVEATVTVVSAPGTVIVTRSPGTVTVSGVGAHGQYDSDSVGGGKVPDDPVSDGPVGGGVDSSSVGPVGPVG